MLQQPAFSLFSCHTTVIQNEWDNRGNTQVQTIILSQNNETKSCCQMLAPISTVINDEKREQLLNRLSWSPPLSLDLWVALNHLPILLGWSSSPCNFHKNRITSEPLRVRCHHKANPKEVTVNLTKTGLSRLTWFWMANEEPVICKNIVSTYMPLQSFLEALSLELE